MNNVNIFNLFKYTKFKNSNFMKLESHCWHIVDNSPWPFLTSLSLLFFLSGAYCSMHKVYNGSYLLLISLLLLLTVVLLWSKDCIRESYQGCHTEKVQRGFYTGFVLIILTEVMLFFGVIWSLLFGGIVPATIFGLTWPPAGFGHGFFIGALGIPLLNTTVLISSGITITWAQFCVLENDYKNAVLALISTVTLSVIFLISQWFEYSLAVFSFSDGFYGSIFFFLTGLHGSHVILGTCLILAHLYRLVNYQFNSQKHLGFIFTAWYWHFVDLVWLFLYLFIYLWGNG
jgi:cytochrome c oxidase subunit 3